MEIRITNIYFLLNNVKQDTNPRLFTSFVLINFFYLYYDNNETIVLIAVSDIMENFVT